MINIDSLTIEAFVSENADFFEGARVQKIQQPNRRELILNIRSLGESKKLYININPEFYHICFMSKENELKRNIKIPKSAAMFCMLLRKYLEGAKIIEIKKPSHERIVEIYFEYYDALKASSRLCLAIELMGKHSNVILYNAETKIILGCAHNVGAEKSKERELQGLLPYIYPPKKRKKNLLKTSFGTFVEVISASDLKVEEVLSDSFYEITRPMVLMITKGKSIEKEKLYDELLKVVSFQDFAPNISLNYEDFSISRRENSIECDSVNSMIDEYFTFHQTRLLVRNLKNKLNAIINAQLKKLYTLKSKQELQCEKIEKAEIYKKKGDLLIAHSYEIKEFEKKVTLKDYETNEDIKIELDETLNAIENANKFYKLYKKAKTSFEHATELLKETELQIKYFEEQKYFVQISSEMSELEDILEELKPENKKPQEKELKCEVKDISGFKVYVGKNSKQNDYILSKISSSNDIWFHPQNGAGAHIILKRNNAQDTVPDEVLLEAAKLAKTYSAQTAGSKMPIIYTLCKYVKKANCKGLAFVTYKNEKEIYC